MRQVRFIALMGITGLMATALAGCESNEVPTCYAQAADGTQEAFFASDHGGDEAATLAACEAAAEASGGDVVADTTDDGSAADVEAGDPVTGATTVSVEVDGVVMGWTTNDGVRVCIEKSRVFWDVNAQSTFTVGYGWGGETDWEALLHSADQYRYSGTLYVCPVSAATQLDANGLFVQNFTRLGSAGPDDPTNWAQIYNGDQFACVTGETSDGAPTYALAYSVHSDRDTYWSLSEASQGSCEAAVD